MLQMLLIGAMNIILFVADIAFGAAILYMLYQIADEPDMEFIDFKVCCLFVFIPGVLIFAIASLLGLFGLTPEFAFAGMTLYVLIPFFWLTYFLDFSNKSAALYAIMVPIAILTKWALIAGASFAYHSLFG